MVIVADAPALTSSPERPPARPQRQRNGGIGVVIVTHNRLAMLQRAVASIVGQAVDRVLVVDNASTDGTADWLAGQGGGILEGLRLETNCGGAGGFHRGFRWMAEHTDVEWILCFDDDAYADPEAIAVFHGSDIPPFVGGVAGAVFLPDGRISAMNRPSFNPFGTLRRAMRTLLQGTAGFHLDEADYFTGAARMIDCASFVGYAVRARLARTLIGYPSAELFIYGDDILYSYRITQAGYRNLFLPAMRFVHDCETLSNNRKVYRPLWKAYYTYRNGLLMYRSFAGRWWTLVLLAKVLAWFAAVRSYDRKLLYLKILAISVVDGLRSNLNRSFEEVRRLAGAK